MKRLVSIGLAALIIATSAAYLGARTGRAFERNQKCCEIATVHNLRISVEEAVGLLRFPSQIGQDRWVAEKVFPGVRDGYFLDVGSWEGYKDSNTWALEQRGWTGVCVDPFPGDMTGRTCQMFKEAVDGVGGQKVAFAAAGNVGGITDHLGLWKDGVKGAQTVELTTTTLADILRRAQAPSFIHFMSLDIEGAELEALKGFPFDRYRLGALAIEHNYEEPKRTDIEQFLAAKGYVRARRWLQDDLYLPRLPAGSMPSSDSPRSPAS